MSQPPSGHPHAITIAPAGARVTVQVGNQVIADTENALTLREGNLPEVLYVPRQDAILSLLERTDHTTHCPFKGDASYFSIPTGGERSTNAVWSYESPLPGAEAIRDHLAFYPDKVDQMDVQPL